MNGSVAMRLVAGGVIPIMSIMLPRGFMPTELANL